MTFAPLLLCAAAAASPYASGERMKFSIDLAGMRVGIATISVGAPGERGVPVKLVARTTGITGAVYDFRESLVSWIDPRSGLPTYFELDLDENGWKHYDTAEFDRAAGQAIIIERGKTTSTDEVPIAEDTLDFIALVFQLRRMPLEVGTRRTFSVLRGTKGAREVVAEVTGRETVKTKVGSFAAFKIRVPTGFTGSFSEKRPTHIWLSDDPRRVVVKLGTDFSFGSGAANLISYAPGEAGEQAEAGARPE
jgi:hypothetical protein